MAKRLNYEIGFMADTKQLDAELQKVQKQLNNISNFKFTGAEASNGFTVQLQEASKAAADLQAKLSSAVNVNTGKLDLAAFRTSLQKSGVSLQDYANKLRAIGPEGTKAFINVANAIAQAELPLRRSSTLLNELWTTMKNTARWQLTSSALHSFMGAIQTAYGYSKDLNESLNNIRIVSGKSVEEMRDFAKEANNAAKVLSTTTTDYTDAALIYYQQGLGDEAIKNRTDTTIKMANITKEGAEEVSSYLTAIWNNFNKEGQKAEEYYADVITKLGATTAASSREIASSLEKFAPVSDVIGLSYEYATASVATIIDKTRQSEEVVGTALKTIFARIQGLKLGETLDDGTSLNKYSEALDKVGISIFDQAGQLKDMDNILDEMGAKWQSLDRAQRDALAQTVAGVRQYTQLITLMDSWDAMQANVNIARGSEGSLQQQANIYAESWEAARDRVRASAEDIYDSLINDQMFIDLDNSITPMLSTIADVIDAMGGLKGIVPVVAYAMTSLYSDKIAQGLRNTFYNIQKGTGIVTEQDSALKQLAADLAATYASGSTGQEAELEAQARKVALQVELNKYAKDYTDEQKRQAQAIIDSVAAMDNFAIATRKVAEEAKLAADTAADRFSQIGEQRQQKVRLNNTQANIFSKKQLEGVFGQNSNFIKDFNLGAAGTSLDAFIQKFKQLKTYQGQLDVISNSFKELKEAIDDGKITNEQYQERLEALKKSLKSLGITNVADDLSNLDAIIGQTDKMSVVFEEKLRATAKLFGENSREARILEEALNIITDAARNAGSSMETSGQVSEEAAKDFNAASQKFRDIALQQKDWATIVTNVGQGLMSVSMGINAIQSLGRVFSDEDMSAGERLTTILTSTSMLLPMVVSLNKLLGPSNILLAKGIGLKVKNAIAERGLAAATTETAKATVMANAAFAGTLAALLPIAAIIGVVVGAIAIASKQYNKLADDSKALGEETQRLEERYKSLKAARDNFASSFNSYETEINKLGELTKGTEEYEKALNSANEKALELIDSNKDLAAYAHRDKDTGLITFDNESIKNYKIELDQSVIDAQRTALISQISSNNANLAVERQKLERELAKDAIGSGSKNYAYSRLDEVLQAIQENGNFYDKEIIAEIPGLGQFADYFDNFSGALENYTKSVDKVAKSNEFLVSEVARTYAEQFGGEAFKNLSITGQNVVVNHVAENLEEINGTPIEETDAYKKALAEYTPQNMGADYANKREQVYEEYARNNNYTYRKGALGQIQLFDENNNKISLPDFELTKQQLARNKAINTLTGGAGDTEEFTKKIAELTELGKQYGDIFGEEFSDILVKAADQTLTDTLDLSALNPEQAKELSGSINSILSEIDLNDWNLGTLISEKIAQGLKSYDPISHYLYDSKQSLEKIDNIGKALLNFEEKDEFTEQQLAFLRTLEAEYENLGEIEDKTSHKYLSTLREIREQEAVNAIESLEEAKKLSKEKAEQLEKERERLGEEISKGIHSGKGVSNEVSINFKAKTDELNAALDEIQNQDREIDIAVKAAIDSDIANGFNIIDEYENLYKSIPDSLKISYDKVQEIVAAGNGAMLENCVATTDGQIQLNEAVVREFVEDKKQEIQADKDAKIAQIKHEITILEAYQDLLDQRVELTKGQYSDEAIAKLEALNSELALEKEKLNKKILAENKANEKSTENAGKTAEKKDSIHENSIQNEQAGYSAADFSAQKHQANTIKYYSQMAQAVAEYAQAVKAAEEGKVYRGKFVQVGFLGGINTGYINPNPNNDSSLDLDSDSIDFEGDLTDLKAQLEEQGNKLWEEMHEHYTEAANENKNTIGALKGLVAALEGVDNSGLQFKGSGGSGSKDKDLKEVKDRYHEINREIKEQSRLLKQLNSDVDRAYGIDKLNLYDKNIAAMEKMTELQEKKIKEAKSDLNSQADVIKALGANINSATGEITNYIDTYNKIQENYKAQRSAASDSEKDALEKTYEANIKALEDYEEMLDAYKETIEDYQDQMREIEDMKLEKIQVKLQLAFDIRDAKKELNDFAKIISESLGDAVTHGLESIKIDYENAVVDESMLDTYQEHFNDIMKLYDKANGYSNMQGLHDQLTSLRGEIISTGEALVDYIQSLDEALPNALNDAKARFDWFIDSLEHNEQILSSIKDIITLQAISNDDIDKFAELDKIYTSRMNNALATAKLQKTYNDQTAEALTLASTKLAEAEATLVKRQAALENAEGNKAIEEATTALVGAQQTYDILKANRDALLEQYQETQKALLDSTKETMEAAREIYTNAIEQTMKNLETSIAGSLGFEILQTKYDNFIETEERHLDEVNKIYEMNKLNMKLQSSLDTSNSAYEAKKLKDLQEEFKWREANTKLSQYDVDIMNARYEMTLKQIALEEAQNAKTSARLVRNASGNYSYVFTANQDDVAKAQQDYYNAQNEYYNKAKEQAKSTSGEILDTWKSMMDELEDIYKDDELTQEQRQEKIAQLQEFYNQKSIDLEAEKQKAIRDLQYLMDTDLSESEKTAVQAYIDELNKFNSDNFSDEFFSAITKMDEATAEYNSSISDINQSTGTSYEELNKVIDKVTESTKDLEKEGQKAVESMWNSLDAIQEQTNKYAEQAEAIMKVVKSLQALAVETSKDYTKPVDSTYYGGGYYVGSVTNKFEIPNDISAKLAEMAASGSYNQAEWDFLVSAREDKIASGKAPEGAKDNATVINIINTSSNADLKEIANGTKYFDTGGYTGNFADDVAEGKLAFLHQKELVLNQKDTENILSAVQMIRDLEPAMLRDIAKTLDKNALAGQALMATKLSGMSVEMRRTDAGEVVQQSVSVEATFPGVQSAAEIENALNSLINDAAQYSSIKHF